MSHAPIPISTHHRRPGLPAAILAACVLLLAVMPAAQDATVTLDVVGLQARLAAIEADAKHKFMAEL